MDAAYMGKHIPQSPGSPNTRKSIQERNLMYMLNVAKPSSLNHVSFYLRKVRLERNPLYVDCGNGFIPKVSFIVHWNKVQEMKSGKIPLGCTREETLYLFVHRPLTFESYHHFKDSIPPQKKKDSIPSVTCSIRHVIFLIFFIPSYFYERSSYPLFLSRVFPLIY